MTTYTQKKRSLPFISFSDLNFLKFYNIYFPTSQKEKRGQNSLPSLPCSESINKALSDDKNTFLQSNIGQSEIAQKAIEEKYAKLSEEIANLASINPYIKKKEKLIKTYASCMEEPEEFLKTHFQELSKEQVQYFNQEYVSLEENTNSAEKDLQHAALNKNLHKTALEEIEKSAHKWHNNEVNILREILWQDLRKYLQTLERINRKYSNLKQPSLGWGGAISSDLFDIDISELEKLLNIISRNKNLQNLIHLIGRSIATAPKEVIEKVSFEKKIEIIKESYHSKEEMKTIEFNNDLMRVTPQELVLLADPLLENLFYQKYSEKNLLCYMLTGQEIEQISKTEIKEEISTEDDTKGPIIACVDTSGSMMGKPEQVAKAVMLALTSCAQEEDRGLYIINFSVDIECIKFEKNTGMSKIIEFLKNSFHGGTDVDPALEHALKMLEEEDYKKADVLVVSDFIMREMQDTMLEKINIQKMKETKFYGLNIGFPGNKPEFMDKQWTYSLEDNSIIEE